MTDNPTRIAGLAIDAVSDDAALESLIHAVRSTVDAANHLILLQGDRVGGISILSTSWSQRAQSLYNSHFFTCDIWAQALAACKRELLVRGEELVPDRVFGESEVYRDFGRTEVDTRYLLALAEPLGGNLHYSFALHRSDRQGPFTEDVMPQLVAVAPFLRGMMRGRAAFDELRLRAATGFAALDALSRPLIVVDRQQRIVHMNPSAESWIKANGAWSILSNAPASSSTLHGANDRAALQVAIVRVVDGVVAADRVVVNLPDPIAVEIIRLRIPATGHGARSLALLAFRQSISPESVQGRHLRGLYGLTEAEADLAAAIARGTALSDYAVAQGISIHTARSHLKRIQMKTDTHRQADLVRLIMTKLGA